MIPFWLSGGSASSGPGYIQASPTLVSAGSSQDVANILATINGPAMQSQATARAFQTGAAYPVSSGGSGGGFSMLWVIAGLAALVFIVRRKAA